MGALSKGCATCKRRKIKCDEVHPTCTRCRDSGLECTRSGPRLRFVNENPRIRRSIAVSHAQSREFSTATRNSNLAFRSSRVDPLQSLSLKSALTNPLSLTAFKNDIFMAYLLSKFFDGAYQTPFNESVDICVLPTDWIPEILQSHRKSWDALAAIAFGNAHKSSIVIRNASELYGQALSELRKKFLSPDKWSSDSMLASVTALYIYEIIAWKVDRGWLFHANGLGWLLEWRGPWFQKSCIGKSIFLEHRIALIAKSIISGQTTFLREKSWKTVPWEDDPTSKLPMDYLVDIGADIAEYLTQIKIYKSHSTNQEDEYFRIKSQVFSSLEELNIWWLKWEAGYSQFAMEVVSPQSTKEPIFPTLLQYDSLWIAFTLCIYNSMRILLLQICDALHIVEETDPCVVLSLPNETALLGITSDIKGLACEIIRSPTYCYGKSRRFVSTFSFLFIQDVAYSCLDQNSKEAIWAAQHGWAEAANAGDIGDANLLRNLIPLGQINVARLILCSGGQEAGV